MGVPDIANGEDYLVRALREEITTLRESLAELDVEKVAIEEELEERTEEARKLTVVLAAARASLSWERQYRAGLAETTKATITSLRTDLAAVRVGELEAMNVLEGTELKLKQAEADLAAMTKERDYLREHLSMSREEVGRLARERDEQKATIKHMGGLLTHERTRAEQAEADLAASEQTRLAQAEVIGQYTADLTAAREELGLLRFIRAHAAEYRYEDENGEPNWISEESDLLTRYQPGGES